MQYSNTAKAKYSNTIFVCENPLILASDSTVLLKD